MRLINRVTMTEIKEFAKFVIIGGINTVNCAFFSYIYSMRMDANFSFILGYLTSLIISYILNSKITFHRSLEWKDCYRYMLSYIPNFLIQNFVVLLIYNLFHFNKLIAYAVAALFGVPITFLLLKKIVYTKVT